MKWILSFCLLVQTIFAGQSYVTYGPHCEGRFGDQLLHYLHAKWLSYHFGIPLLYRPSPYFEDLTFAATEPRFEKCHKTRVARLDLSHAFQLSAKGSIVYECPYFPAFKEEQVSGRWGGFEVDWKDPEFRRVALRAIAPRDPLKLLYPPVSTISIAIHVREGGGYENIEEVRKGDPFKAPPMDFYSAALIRILPMLSGKKIYCHIFTDAAKPEAIARQIERDIPPLAPVVFGYRAVGNHHAKNVLEDFFSLFNFDILIRPRSNFSVVPSLLHDYALLCYPAEFTKGDKGVASIRIKVEKNEELLSEILNSH